MKDKQIIIKKTTKKVQCSCGLWFKNKYTLKTHKKSYKHKCIMLKFID